MTIEIEYSYLYGKDLSFLEKIARAVLLGEGMRDHFRVFLLLTDDPGIRRINYEHRGIDRETDVLSFPMLSPFAEPKPVDFDPQTREYDLGDVVLSIPRAQAQAELFGHTIEREIGYLFAHAMLHLIGYDHEQDDEREIMRFKEEAALKTVGLNLNLRGEEN